MWLNVHLRISLNQSGSTLLLQLLSMMFFCLPWLLFQVAGCGVMYCKSLFPTQSMSQQLYSPPCQKLIHTLLSELSKIESSVNTLSQTTDSELLCSYFLLFANSSSFPLQHLFFEYHSLDTDLEKVESKEASITAMKASIKSQLDTVDGKLHTAKLTWKENWEKLRLNMVEQTGVKHSTSKGYWFCGAFFCWDSNITDCFFEPILVGVDPIHQLSIFLVIACQVIFGQGHRGCSFMFSMLQYLVQLCLMWNTENLSQRDQALLSDFPADPQPAQKVLLLEHQPTIFAICPKHCCQQSHKPTFNPGSPIPVYPKNCLGHHFGKPCKQELLCPKEKFYSCLSNPLYTSIQRTG